MYLKRFSIMLAVLAVLLAALLISASGCKPMVAGFFGDKPVDRATFERQAAKRRGELMAERAMLTAKLAAAQGLGDAQEIAAVKADIAVHEAESKTYNEMYGYGIADLDRQAEANEQVFTTLTAATAYGGAAVGLPPGVSQMVIGALLGIAGRAGWIRIKQKKTAAPPDPPSPTSPPAPSDAPVVQA